MMDIADGLAAEVYFTRLAFLASDDCDGSRCQEHALPELYRRHIQQMRQCHTGDAEMAEADDDGFAVCFIRMTSKAYRLEFPGRDRRVNNGN